MSYVDGELLAEERVDLEAHLSACATCAKHVEVQRHNQSLIRATAKVDAPKMPEELRARLTASLQQTSLKTRRTQMAKISAAAAVVVAVTAGAQWQYRTAQRRLYAEDAVRRHARQYPLEVLEPSEGNLEKWFGGKLDHRVPVPHIPNTVTAGARLLNVRDKQAAYIRYEAAEPNRPPRNLGLFVFGDTPGEVDIGVEPAVANSNGFNVVSWRDGDVVYQLVTDLDERDVLHLVPSVTGRVPANRAPLAQPASFQH